MARTCVLEPVCILTTCCTKVNSFHLTNCLVCSSYSLLRCHPTTTAELQTGFTCFLLHNNYFQSFEAVLATACKSTGANCSFTSYLDLRTSLFLNLFFNPFTLTEYIFAASLDWAFCHGATYCIYVSIFVLGACCSTETGVSLRALGPVLAIGTQNAQL